MRIAILGAGYGGLAAARKLDWWLGPRHRHQVLLVERGRTHQLIVRMHEVAAGSIPPEDAEVPIERALAGRGIQFRVAVVTGLDADHRVVRTSTGDVPFDYLVVALGGETEYFGLPGVCEHSLALKGLQDALRIRRHVEGQVVRARREQTPDRRAARLTFVLGGGGFTGTELAGELADRVRELAALHEVRSEPRILVLEASDKILPGFPDAVARRAAEILAGRGVEVRLRTPVAGAEPGTVRLASGECIAAETFIWAGGARASPVVADSGLPTGTGGRACLDPFPQWEGQSGIFAIGDCSQVADPDGGCPLLPSAQLAIHQGEHAASNVYRALGGRAMIPFRPLAVAEVVSLGRHEAIAMAGSVVFDGPQARALKNLSYTRYLLSIGAWPPLPG